MCDHCIYNLKIKITVCYWIQYLPSFGKENRELYVNLTILAVFFVIIQLKIIATKFRKLKKMRLVELQRIF